MLSIQLCVQQLNYYTHETEDDFKSFFLREFFLIDTLINQPKDNWFEFISQ